MTVTEAAAAAAAPWWGVPLVAGVFTVLGVVVAQLVAWRIDQRKVRREDEQRWLTDRRQAYAAFLTAATRFHMKLKPEWEKDPADDMTDAIAEVNFHRQEIRLIASEPVSAAAEELFMQLARMRRTLASTAYTDRGEQAWRDLAKVFQDRRQTFIAAARDELGVTL